MEEIGIGLRLSLMAPDKHGVEGMGFDLSDNSIVTILEENASKNYIKIKFSNMVFENISLHTVSNITLHSFSFSTPL